MDEIKIDLLKDGLEKAKEAIKNLFNGALTSVSLKNAPASLVERILESCGADVNDCEDFNGWQCDYWNSCEYDDKKYNIFGCAWYGTATISDEE